MPGRILTIPPILIPISSPLKSIFSVNTGMYGATDIFIQEIPKSI